MELTFALPLSPAFALLLVRVFLSLLSFCPSLLLLSLTHSLSRARSLGCDAASCSCRCWPCAALARLCLARTYPVPPSSPSRFSFAPISLSSRQALVAPRHQAAPLPLGCSLLLVEHHHHCTCHTFAINQSSWRGFRCKSLTDECIVVVPARFVIRSNTRYDEDGVGYAAPLRTHLGSLTLSLSLVCLFFSCLCSATANSHSRLLAR